MSLRRVLFAAVTVALSSLLLFGLAELALRMLFPERVVATARPADPAFEFNDSYLVALKKSVVKEYPGESSVNWRTNRDGFRGDELRQADARVIVYGDSNVLARFSTLEDTFTAQLATRLSAGLGRDVEVINAGVIGFGPDQSLLKMEAEIDQVRADLVVLHLFADNDFGDLMRNRLFELDERGRLVETRHVRRPDAAFGGESAFVSSLLLVRAVRKLLDSYWNEARLKSEFALYRSGGEQVVSPFSDIYDSDLALYPDSPSALAKRSLMDGVLARAKDLAHARGFRLAVVVQPAIFDLTTTLVPNYESFAAFDGYRPSNLTSFATASADAAGLPVLNLYESFRQNDPAQLYFQKSDNHWNERGQALAAQELASFIIRLELLTPH